MLRNERGGVVRVPVAAGEVGAEVERFRRAAATAAGRLEELSRSSRGEIGSEVAAILAAHALIASDPEVFRAVSRRIEKELVNAEWALHAVAEELRGRFEKLADPAFSARGEDLATVRDAILAELSSSGAGPLDLPALEEGTVLVADDLTPAQAVRLHPERLQAIALERGGPYSHAAIIARSFGIPAVVGVAGLLAGSSSRRPIVVDGTRGTVETNPTKTQLRRAIERLNETRKTESTAPIRRAAPARTADGVEVVLRGNLELPEELPAISRFGAAGIGLFRTEYLQLRSPEESLPFDEEVEIYRLLLRANHPNPVVIRTLDLGGEKSPGATGGAAGALGLRGLRRSLAREEEFRRQLRALLAAAAEGDLRILLPMVTSPAEIRRVRAILADLAQVGGPPTPPLGVMIEVPSAAILADEMVAEADFLSIGTNDLAQYVLAADRTDTEVEPYYKPFAPAVLRMVKSCVDAAIRASKPVTICGEIAGDPAGAALLVGLGVRELSMSPILVPAVAKALAELSADKLERFAERALKAAESEEVESILAGIRRRIQ